MQVKICPKKTPYGEGLKATGNAIELNRPFINNGQVLAVPK